MLLKTPWRAAAPWRMESTIDTENCVVKLPEYLSAVVRSGDPFEFSSQVEHVFIRGKESDLSNRPVLLFQRYRTHPGTADGGSRLPASA
jgi:hypothetical protein